MTAALWPTLGFARFLLALVVAGCHLAAFTDKGDPVAELKQFSGLVAVMSFLVLSGYSIAASFERDRERFYFRRALRILPLYVPVVALSGVLPIFLRGDAVAVPVPSYEQMVLNLCFAQGFFADSIDANPVVWTLSLEVFFYAITPWLARLPDRALLAIAGGFALCYVNSTRVGFVHHPSALYGVNVVLLGWTWLLGFWMHRARGRAAEVALAIGVLAVTLQHAGIHRWWIFTWAVPFAALLVAPRISLRPGVARAFGFLGDISYPLYLAHYPAYLLLDALGAPRTGALLLGGALVVAVVLDALFDKPAKNAILRLVERMPRWSAGRGAPQPATSA